MPVILIELVLVLGVTLGIGLWQLYDVNKALKDGEKDKDGTSADDAERAESSPAEPSSDGDR